jgi:DNA-directed RNA polymerase subunit RPC12/RpoP
MIKYHCNCCGHDFYESESSQNHIFDDEVVCPNCGAYYDEEDETYIERYNE